MIEMTPTIRIFKIIYYIVLLSILGLQIYALIFVFPAERKALEKCEWKILCERGLIDSPKCSRYKKQDVPNWNVINQSPSQQLDINITS